LPPIGSQTKSTDDQIVALVEKLESAAQERSIIPHDQLRLDQDLKPLAIALCEVY